MADYVADFRDVKFQLFEFLKIQELQKLAKYADYGKEDYEAIAQAAYDFAKTVLGPLNEVGDKEGAQFADGKVTLPTGFVDAWKKYAENGWVGAIQPVEAGGQGLPWVMGQVIHEFFIGANVSLSLSAGLSEGVLNLLNDFGNDEVKSRYIPALIEARWSGTMCLTEDNAGSDVGANKAVAKRLDDGTYMIEGTKIFITGGDHDAVENVIHAVLARVEGHESGTKGLSLFVIPKYWVNEDGSMGDYNDVSVGRIEHKMGIKGSPTCVLNFGEKGGSRGFILGQEKDGMKIMFHMMNEARIMVGVQGEAIGAVAYETARAYSMERIQGTDIKTMKDPKAPKVAIIQHPDVRRMLLWQKSVVEGLRGLVYEAALFADLAAASDDENERKKCEDYVQLLTPICKLYGSDMGCKVTDLAVQTLGGYGYTTEYPVEQYMRDARIAPIYEGTNGIQALDFAARKLPMKGLGVFMSYLKDVGAFVDKTKSHPRLGKFVTKLGEAKNTLAQVGMKLLTAATQDPEFLALNAYPITEAFGHVVAAYSLLRQAVVADTELNRIYTEEKAISQGDKTKLNEENPEAKFYFGKVMSARFFVYNILPEVKLKAEIISAQDKAAIEMIF